MKKRFLAWLLCICMMASYLPMTAFAEELISDPIIISEIDVTIDIPKAGAKDPTIVYSTNGTGYTVVPHNSGKWVDAGRIVPDQFVSGNAYLDVFEVYCDAGYAIDTTTSVKVNGSDVGVHLLGAPDEPAKFFEFVCNPELEGSVSHIYLTDVPTADIGKAASGYSFSCTEYSATGTWQKYDWTTHIYADMNSAETFKIGNIYRLHLEIETKPGYEFVYGEIYVNDEETDSIRKDYYAEAYITVNHSQIIENVDIPADSIPKASLGESFTDTKINVPVKEGSNYSAYGYWVCDTEFEEPYGTFENGKAYNFVIQIIPNNGYAFSDYMNVNVEGQEAVSYTNTQTEVKCYVRSSFAEKISEVEFLNLPEASVGGELQTDTFGVSVPENASYTAEATWYVFNEEENCFEVITSETVEEGKKYQIMVVIKAKDGYEFTPEVLLKTNGIPVKVSGFENSIYYDKTYSFFKQISKVEVYGLTDPVAGQVPNTERLKVPEGANYVIKTAQWLKSDDYEVISKFEEGQDYSLCVEITPKAGYEFTENVEVFLDSEKVRSYVYSDGTALDMYTDVSFKKIIPEIRVSDLPKMKVGENAENNLKIPENADYTAAVYWYVWDDETEQYINFEDKFENDKTYQLYMVITAKDGYRFDKNITKFFVDDVQKNNAAIDSVICIYEENYDSKSKEINRIELNIAEPIVGHHSSIKPEISIIGDKNYKIDEDWGIEWIFGDLELKDYFYGYFKENHNYGVQATLIADEGYIFAEDASVVINGKIIPKEALWTDGLKICQFTYFFGMGIEETKPEETESETKPEETKPEETKPEETESETKPVVKDNKPTTGDESRIGMWICVMGISMAAMLCCGVVWLKEKRR